MENQRLRREAYEKKEVKKKQKGGRGLATDIEVIDRHLASDVERKKASNRVDTRSNNRGMQDKSQNSSKEVSNSQGQSSKGNPNATKTRYGESGPSHAGIPQNQYAHLQRPLKKADQVRRNPQYPPRYAAEKSSGLPQGSKIKITVGQVPLTTLPTLPPTHSNHPTYPPNHRLPPGHNPKHHHTTSQILAPRPDDPCLPPVKLDSFPQTQGFAPYAHATYTPMPPFDPLRHPLPSYAPYPPPQPFQPLPPAPRPYPTHPHPPPTVSNKPPTNTRVPQNQKSPTHQNR